MLAMKHYCVYIIYW